MDAENTNTFNCFPIACVSVLAKRENIYAIAASGETFSVAPDAVVARVN